MCSQISAVSTIQLGLNLASLKSKTKLAFFENICFFARKTFLEALWDNAKYCESHTACLIEGMSSWGNQKIGLLFNLPFKLHSGLCDQN